MKLFRCSFTELVHPEAPSYFLTQAITTMLQVLYPYLQRMGVLHLRYYLKPIRIIVWALILISLARLCFCSINIPLLVILFLNGSFVDLHGFPTDAINASRNSFLPFSTTLNISTNDFLGIEMISYRGILSTLSNNDLGKFALVLLYWQFIIKPLNSF